MAPAGPWPPALVGLPPAIGSHRLLGDGRSSALVTPDGEVDWWCAPTFDAPPLLWSLLDPAGARASWAESRLVEASPQPAGPTTRTTLALGRARMEVWDALLPVAGGGSALVRLVRALDGAVEVVHELRVGGFDGVSWTWSGSTCRVGDVDVHVTGGRTSVSPAGVARTVLLATEGWSATVVSCSQPVDADAGALAAVLAEAEAAFAAGLDRARLPRHHPDRARDALAVLEACTFRETGAVVASPTTSLPEAPGADRQFDYRFTWLRDASLAVSVASLLGRGAAASRYLSFVHRMVGEASVPERPMSDIRGDGVPAEREVAHVSGWAGSLPVRVGNAAAEQVQMDALGLLLEAVSVYLQTGGSLDSATWELVCAVAEHVIEHDDPCTNGIWELREPRRLVSADIGRWMALDRAVWMARGWRPLTRRRHWKAARDAARDRVLGALGPDGALPQVYDEEPSRLDASGLMAVVFGLIQPDDPRATTVVDTTIAGLGAGPFLYRYEPDPDDGFTGREGAFIPMSWWAVAALAKIGRLEEATARVDALCAELPRLLAEEVDPGTGTSLGNVPLVWSHVEAARTMYLLDASDRRRRQGAARLWLWRLGRFASLALVRKVSDDDLPALPTLHPTPAVHVPPVGGGPAG